MIISKLSKDELIKKARDLKSSISEVDEDQLSRMCAELDSNFSHASVSNLFFWPENYNFRKDKDRLKEYDPTPEEVVEIGILHKSICL